MLSLFAVLDPKGIISLSERSLMIHAIEFMLIVAIPVYILLFFFAYKYRAGGTSAYVPNWEHGVLEELVWWAIPFEIVLVLGALTWTSTHQLDPHVPLSTAPPLVVEVVALEWKWLFIYPSLGIASVNYLQIPVDRPIEFRVTADAPMNSFWIPQLGGQIYAMTGMVNTLNLEASEKGRYKGMSANYSGAGFASMNFMVDVTSQDDFTKWAKTSAFATSTLAIKDFEKLAAPSIMSLPTSYAKVEPSLFEQIVAKFTDPQAAKDTHH